MKTKTNHFNFTRLTNGVRQRASIFIAALFCSIMLSAVAFAQVTVTNPGNVIPGLQANYTSLANAILDLNVQTSISGPVVITLTGDETAPAGGYSITAIPAGTSATNNIVIQGSSSTITANAGLAVGNLNDAIFKLIGADWVTIQNFTMQENPANTVIAAATNNMTEWGVALLYASTTNGAQNNTIQNNTISLNKLYSNTFGVYSNVRHSATDVTTVADIVNATTAPNNGNKVYNNAISNVNVGITFIGSGTAANMDVGNDIGGAAAGTGNNISNWGGLAPATTYVSNLALPYAIYLNHENSSNVSFNTVTSSSMNFAGTTLGIYSDYVVASPAGSFTNNITNNTVTITNATTGTQQIHAIRASNTFATANAGVTVNLNSNTILNCSMPGVANGVTLFGVLSTANFGVVNLNSNIVRGTTTAGTTGGIVGVTSQGAVVTTLNLNNNKLGDASGNFITFSAANSGAVNGVTTSAEITPNVSMSNNDVRGVVYSVTGSGSPLFLANTYAGSGTLTVNNNTFTNLSLNTTGSPAFIQRSGNMTATGAEICNGNSIVTGFAKTASTGAVTYYTSQGSSANGSSMTQTGNNFSNITLTGTTTIAGWNNGEGASSSNAPTKTITGNTFSNVTGGSGAIVVMQTNFGNATTCTGNTISNITGTGAITGISHGSSNGQGTHSYSTNMISTLTSSGTGGSVIGITGGSSSVPTMSVNGNTITGLSSTGASSSVVGIVMSAGAIENVNSNMINSLSATGATSPTVAGIQVTGGTTPTVGGNTINTLSNAGATSPVVNGLSVSAGTTVVVSKNKIYDLSQSGAISTTSPAINGMLFSGGTTVTASNNLVGNLTAPAASLADAIRGISVTSTTTLASYNLYYNTVFINAASSGAIFGTTGLFHTISTTSTTAKLDLRNSIIDNRSTPNGAGLTAVLRRSGGAASNLANYASTSNNNDLFLGPAGANKFIYSDGTSTASTIAAYKAGAFTAGTISPRDSLSFSDPTYQSTTGSSAVFLHIDTTVPTQTESGGLPIAGITDDFDGDARNANFPDVGADEFNGVALDFNPPSISYTLLGVSPVAATRTFSNVTVADPSGVNTTAGTRPRVYYKKSSDANNTFNDNTSGTAGWKYVEATGGGGSPFTFTIDYSLLFGGSVTTGDTIQYFVVAQDLAGTPNVGINSGLFTATPTSVALTAAAFPIGGTINSYGIVTAFSGPYNVGVGGAYTTLTAAITALNAGVVTSPGATFLLTDPTYPSETFPITITNNTATSGNPIMIKATATTAISGSNATTIFDLSGCQFVTIDGSNSGGVIAPDSPSGDLTVRNTGTGATIRFIADASNNTVKRAAIEGQNTSSSGGVVFFSTGTTTGNQNNTIDGNTIRDRTDASGVPVNLIYSSGTSAAVPNKNSTISNNQLNNFTGNGITMSASAGNESWTISGNTIFESAARTTTLIGISFTSLGTNTITLNTIRDLNTSGATTGINVADARATTISRNAIYSFPSTSGSTNNLIGINSNGSSGNPANVTVVNNFISLVPLFTNAQIVKGIQDDGFSGNTWTVDNNTVYIGGTGSGSASTWAILRATVAPDIYTTRNNIAFNNRTGGTGSHFAGGDQSANTGTLVSNFNFYAGTGATAANFMDYGTSSSGTPVSFTTWKTGPPARDASGIGATANTYTVSTFFANAATGDLHLIRATSASTNPAENLGTTLGTVTVDFDGNTRSAIRPDIGADEIASADLSNLTSTAGALVGPFDPATTSYTISVPNGTTSTTVTPTVLDSNATVTVNGTPVTSGTPSGAIALAVGPNPISVVVTPEFGPFVANRGGAPHAVATIKTYTVTVTRAASANADLSALTISTGALTPSFASGTFAYMSSVAYPITSTTVTPTVADATATIAVRVNGGSYAPVTSGSPSSALALNVGANTVDVQVTAQDTTTIETYTITVTRAAPSSNADLSNLVLSDGTLTPAFDSGTTSYTASVPGATSSMTVTPTAADGTATIAVRVNGGSYTPVASGSPSGPLALNAGPNTIDVKVAAQDETLINAPLTIKTYTTTVTRSVSANADLSDLTATAGPLSPAFAANTLSYTVNTPFTTTSTTVTPTAADAGATITVNGNPVTSGSPSGSISLSVGNNTITTVVTAADTTTMKTYTINVIRGGQVVVTGSTGANGSYTTLKAAFDALNANTTQTGNTIEVEIGGNTTETASAVLNNPSGGNWASLTIDPSASVSPTVSGNIASAGLIDLNGTTNVAIKEKGIGIITMSNTNTGATAGTSTIRMLNGASNNLVTNCVIQGSTTGTAAQNGTASSPAAATILFGSTTGTGNNSNTISNNNIGPAGANLPVIAISSAGLSTVVPNTGNMISGNKIFDFYGAAGANGIAIGSNSAAFTISNNKFYETAARTGLATANYWEAIFISTASGGGYTVSGNTIGYAAADGSGMFTNNGGRLVGIDLTAVAASPVSDVQGNTVNGLNWTTASTAATAGAATVNGIIVKAGGVNIGTTTANTIGATTGTGTATTNIFVSSTASGTGIWGIYVTSTTGAAISNNNIGAIATSGAAAIGFTITGIEVAGTGSHTITSNTVGNSTANNLAAGVSGTTTAATTTVGINSTGTGTTVSVGSTVGTGNTIQNMSSFGSATTSLCLGIRNTGAAGTYSANFNTFTANTLAGGGSAAGTTYYANVLNSGAVTAAFNANNNTVNSGTISTATYAGTSAFIISSAGATTSTASIQNNTFTGLTFTGATGSTGAFYGINHSVGNTAQVSKNISNNAFNNLTLKTSGQVILVYSNDITPNMTVSGNSIGTQFTRSVSSAVGLYGIFSANANGSSNTAGVQLVSNNNFSNITSITTSAATTGVVGMIWQPGATSTAAPTVTISGNTFSNHSNSSTAPAAGIIADWSNNLTISGNLISDLSTGGATATGIQSAVVGTTSNVFKNKIYNLSTTTNTAGITRGISLQTSTGAAATASYNIYNNLIGNLFAPSASGNEQVIGISTDGPSSARTDNLYYNTIYLNATGGANFGTSAISVTSTPTVTLRNNVLMNTSTAAGTGTTVVYRRSSATLTTYGSTSNNNDFYAGNPGTANLIFTDGATSDQTIAAYKTRVASRDSASFTESPTFLSLTGSDPTFLHINAVTPTHLESGSVNIAGITDDFDAQTRQGNPGYVGTGTAPDVGADEFEGTALAYNADLSNLTLSMGTLTPAFASGTTSYTASVGFTTTSLTETPTVADATSSVTVNGNPVVSGTPSGSIALAVGPNVITTVVTAQDGTTMKTYTVTVTRAAASSNADLSDLVLSAGSPLTPPFTSGTTSYTLNVPYTTTSTTVTPTTADGTATVTVNGNPVASGSPSGVIALAVGPNVITTVVTAQDNTMKTYTVTVTRAAASSNADLSNLVLSDGTLNPAFSAGTTSYTANVPNATSSMTVTPTAADANATIAVQVNGSGYSPVTSGSPSGSLPLNVGANTVDVKVSAQDEGASINLPATIKVYTVTVTRAAAASNNADLSDLTATAGPLSPAFDANTLSYTINVPFTTTSTTVTPTAADGGATITVTPPGGNVPSGTPSGSISLNVGNNIITTVVTASDTTTMKTYTINVIRGAQVVVSGSTGADGSYATLKLAFDALNANGTQAGNAIMVSILGDTTETATAALNQPSVSSWTSLSIKPSGARTVSGSLAAPLVDLAGADNVTIDGLNSAGNTLTVSNTNTGATTSTIRLINGAMNDTVTNCSVLGSSTGAVTAASGTILISTSSGGTNSGNIISNNNIGPAGANLPTKGFTSLGSASPNNNSGNMLDNNNIFDFFSATVSVSGISLQNNTTTMTVSNNRLYQTAPRTFTGAALNYAGITSTIGTGAGTATITGNKIGFGAADGTGTTSISGNTGTFTGMNLSSASTVTPTSVQNNTISGVSLSTAGNAVVVFNGIFFAAGRYDVGTVTGNKIGSLDGSSTITVTLSSNGAVYLMRDSSSSSNTIANNQIGAITINGTGAGGNGFRGILLSQGVTTVTATVTNNQIGGSGAGGITDTLVGGYALYAIANSSGNLVATGNTIRNISGNSNAAATIVISGMLLTGTGTAGGPNIISQNVVHSLSNNAGTASNSIYAIYCSFPAATANVVERNFVHSLSITSTDNTSQLIGILPVAGTGTYKNNMVRLGVDAAGASITAGLQIYGMFEIAGTNSLYYNSVYIGGTGVVGTGQPTFGFVSNVTTGTRNYLDNIFWNARSNGSGTGNNYAISLAAITGATTNRNDLYASGTNGVVGRLAGADQITLTNWQTATGQDAMSISANPQFVNPIGTAATVDLHINCASPADGRATPIAGITTDFDNETRDATNPDIGADEINLVAPVPVSAVSRKVHGGAGTYDINLPFAGPAGVECRSGGVAGNYQIVFTFGSSVTVSGAVVSAGTGSIALVSGSGTNTITVDLAGVASEQYLTVKLLCVDDTVNLGSVSATMGVLIGDVDATGMVGSTDISTVKMEVGNPVGLGNFRTDVLVNGAVNSSDVSLVKSKSGTGLP